MTTSSKNTNTTKAILHNLSMLEALRNKRILIYDLVKDQIDDIDKEKKETIRSLKAQFVGLADRGACVDVANILCPTLQNADDAERKRISRRRSTMINILKGQFTDYDFEVQKGRTGGKIIATFIGDSVTRKANEMIAVTLETLTLLGVTIPKGVTVESLVNQLKDGAIVVPSLSVDDIVDVGGIDFKAIAEKAASINDAKKAISKKIA
jgi:hypothetical protein